MSSQAVAWAIVHRAGGPSAKAVLLSIANYADASGECWQDQPTLAAGADCSVRQFRNILKGLIERGLVEQVRRGNTSGGGRKPNLIRLRMRDLPVIISAKEPTVSEYRKPAIQSNRQTLPETQLAANIAGKVSGNPARGNRQTVAGTIDTPTIPTSSEKNKRASRLPADWAPKPREVAQGVEGGLSEAEVYAAADHMRDWAASSPKAVKLDWDATFRNWLRTTISDAKRGRRPVVSGADDAERKRRLWVLETYGEWRSEWGPRPDLSQAQGGNP